MAFQERLKKKNKPESERVAEEIKAEAEKKALAMTNQPLVEDESESIKILDSIMRDDKKKENPKPKIDELDIAETINHTIEKKMNPLKAELKEAIFGIAGDFSNFKNEVSKKISEKGENDQIGYELDHIRDKINQTSQEQEHLKQRIDSLAAAMLDISKGVVQSEPIMIDENDFIKWAFSVNPKDHPSCQSLGWIQKYKRKSMIIDLIRLINYHKNIKAKKP